MEAPQFANADEIETLEGVPIFHAHQAKDADGTERSVTADDLDTIARVNNERTKQGEPAVIHVGHTDGTHTEKPIHGFMRNYRTGLRDGIPTLFADWDVFKEDRKILRQYPRRSVEIYQEDAPESKRWVIPSVALVGSNEPALKLGVMYRATDQSHLAKFTLQNTEQKKMAVDEEMKTALLEVLEQSDVFKWCRERMKNDAEKAAEDAAPFEKSDENEVMDAEDSAAESEGEKEVMADEDKKKKSMSTAKYTALEREVVDLKRKYRNSERKTQLVELQAAGFDVEVDDEISECDDMNDKQFERHVERLKKFTARAPIGTKFGDVRDVPHGGGSPSKYSQDRLNRVQAYARANRCSFEVADAAVK